MACSWYQVLTETLFRWCDTDSIPILIPRTAFGSGGKIAIASNRSNPLFILYKCQCISFSSDSLTNCGGGEFPQSPVEASTACGQQMMTHR